MRNVGLSEVSVEIINEFKLYLDKSMEWYIKSIDNLNKINRLCNDPINITINEHSYHKISEILESDSGLFLNVEKYKLQNMIKNGLSVYHLIEYLSKKTEDPLTNSYFRWNTGSPFKSKVDDIQKKIEGRALSDYEKDILIVIFENILNLYNYLYYLVNNHNNDLIEIAQSKKEEDSTKIESDENSISYECKMNEFFEYIKKNHLFDKDKVSDFFSKYLDVNTKISNLYKDNLSTFDTLDEFYNILGSCGEDNIHSNMEYQKSNRLDFNGIFSINNDSSRLESIDAVTKHIDNNQYHGLFLSHNHNDKSFVRDLKRRLEENGVEDIWIDEAEIKVGDSLIAKIQEGLEKTKYIAVILSPDSIKSGWVLKELDTAMTREIATTDVVVLPILYKKCDLPAFLKGKKYADFTEESKYKSSLDEILMRLKKT